MSIQQTNPLTDNDNVIHCEVGENGFVAADLDTGLLYGNVQLPVRANPDEWFLALTGKQRPDIYKQQLREIVDSHEPASEVPDVLLEAAKDVLDDKTDTHVLVTTLNIIDVGRRFGFLAASNAHALTMKPGDLTTDGIQADGTPAQAGQGKPDPDAEGTPAPPPTDQKLDAEQAGNGTSGKKGKGAALSTVTVQTADAPTVAVHPAPDAPGDTVGGSANPTGVIATSPVEGTDAQESADAAKLSATNSTIRTEAYNNGGL